MTSGPPPADDYEMGEFTKALMRRAIDRYQTNAMTHAEVELTINLLITEGKLAPSRMGMIGFVREATALAILVHDELFDEAGNVKIDFPRTTDQVDLKSFEQTEHLGKHVGVKEFLDAPLTGCRGFVPMAGFGETRCKNCGRPKDLHPVKVQP